MWSFHLATSDGRAAFHICIKSWAKYALSAHCCAVSGRGRALCPEQRERGLAVLTAPMDRTQGEAVYVLQHTVLGGNVGNHGVLGGLPWFWRRRMA